MWQQVWKVLEWLSSILAQEKTRHFSSALLVKSQHTWAQQGHQQYDLSRWQLLKTLCQNWRKQGVLHISNTIVWATDAEAQDPQAQAIKQMQRVQILELLSCLFHLKALLKTKKILLWISWMQILSRTPCLVQSNLIHNSIRLWMWLLGNRACQVHCQQLSMTRKARKMWMCNLDRCDQACWKCWRRQNLLQIRKQAARAAKDSVACDKSQTPNWSLSFQRTQQTKAIAIGVTYTRPNSRAWWSQLWSSLLGLEDKRTQCKLARMMNARICALRL